MNTKPILVYRNESQIEETQRLFEIHKGDYQKMIDEFADLGIGTIETGQDFNDACVNPMEFIKRKTAEHIERNPVTIANIRLKLDKVVELLDIQDVQQFKAAAAAARNSMHFFQRIGKIEGGKAVVDRAKLAEYIEQNSLYADTPKKLEVLKAVNLIAEAATILKSVGKPQNLAGIRLIDFIVANGEGYTLNHERWQFHTNNL